MEYKVSLGRIRANPWQTRLGIDESYIQELAADIERRGLLQPPAGRIVNKDARPVEVRLLNPGGDITDYLEAGSWFVELAFGHNRAMAFHTLAEKDERWRLMPVRIVAFTDEEMASAAWAENAQRKDLSPMEEAKAIKHRMKSFGWTQDQVATALGLARSTVANKLRILEMSEEIQAALEQREITERQALAIAPVFALPAPVQAQMEELSWVDTAHDLLEAARQGTASPKLRERARKVAQNTTDPIADFPWPATDEFFGAGLQASRCDECPVRVRLKDEMRCGDRECQRRKLQAWQDSMLRQASAATGIPVLESDLSWAEYTHFAGADYQIGREIVEAGCEKLRLVQHNGNLQVEGHDGVAVVCAHRDERSCACLRARKAAQTRNDPVRIREREQKKKLKAEVVEPAVEVLAEALIDLEAGAWSAVLEHWHYQLRGKTAKWSMERIARRLMAGLVEAAVPYNGHRDIYRSRTEVTKLLEQAGVEPPWDSEVERPMIVWREKAKRVTTWVAGCARQIPTPEQVAGNQENLRALEVDAEDLKAAGLPEEDVDETLAEIVAVRERLEAIQALLDDLGPEDSEAARTLVGVWPTARQFQTTLREARPALVRYALVCANGENRQALEERLASVGAQTVETGLT